MTFYHLQSIIWTYHFTWATALRQYCFISEMDEICYSVMFCTLCAHERNTPSDRINRNSAPSITRKNSRKTEASVVAQNVKLLLVMLTNHIRAPVLFLISQLWIQLPTDLPGKAGEDGPRARALTYHPCETPERSFWLLVLVRCSLGYCSHFKLLCLSIQTHIF